LQTDAFDDEDVGEDARIICVVGVVVSAENGVNASWDDAGNVGAWAGGNEVAVNSVLGALLFKYSLISLKRQQTNREIINKTRSELKPIRIGNNQLVAFTDNEDEKDRDDGGVVVDEDVVEDDEDNRTE